MRGRKPKAIGNQIAGGDPRKIGKKKLQARLEAEPPASKGLPDCPRHLRGRARYAWTFWAEELMAMNLDRRPDAMMLEGNCVSYARAVEADLILQRDGLTVEESIIDEKSGKRIVLKIKKHPANEISNACWRAVRSFCSEFGMSPVSRTRLSIEKKDSAGEDLMAILGAPRARRTETTVN